MNISTPSLQLIAGGNMTPYRVAKLSTAADNTALISASATSVNIGVIQGGTRRAPGTGDDDGYAAIDGDNVQIWGMGSIALIELAGTSTRGDAITADSAGRGVTTTTAGNLIVGWLLQSGTANALCMVLVNPCYYS